MAVATRGQKQRLVATRTSHNNEQQNVFTSANSNSALARTGQVRLNGQIGADNNNTVQAVGQEQQPASIGSSTENAQEHAVDSRNANPNSALARTSQVRQNGADNNHTVQAIGQEQQDGTIVSSTENDQVNDVNSPANVNSPDTSARSLVGPTSQPSAENNNTVIQAGVVGASRENLQQTVVTGPTNAIPTTAVRNSITTSGILYNKFKYS